MKKLLMTLLATITITQSFAQGNMATAIDDAKKSGSYTAAVVGENCITIKAPEDCWKYLGDNASTASASNFINYQGRYLAAFAKYMGWSDVADKSPSYGDDDGKKFVEDEVKIFKGKVSLSLDAGDMPCTEENCKLMMRYASTPGEFMEELLSYKSSWKPKSGEMHVKVLMSSTVKDIDVKTDGKNFTVTCPWKNEPSEWDSKIDAGLKKGGS